MAGLPRRILLFVWRSTRLILGWCFIALGVLGVILPILPGMPWFIIGILLIGRRSRTLRRANVGGKRLLRRWSRDERPMVAAVGRWSLGSWRDTARQLRRMETWWGAWWGAKQAALRRRWARAEPPVDGLEAVPVPLPATNVDEERSRGRG